MSKEYKTPRKLGLCPICHRMLKNNNEGESQVKPIWFSYSCGDCGILFTSETGTLCI